MIAHAPLRHLHLAHYTDWDTVWPMVIFHPTLHSIHLEVNRLVLCSTAYRSITYQGPRMLQSASIHSKSEDHDDHDEPEETMAQLPQNTRLCHFSYNDEEIPAKHVKEQIEKNRLGNVKHRAAWICWTLGRAFVRAVCSSPIGAPTSLASLCTDVHEFASYDEDTFEVAGDDTMSCSYARRLLSIMSTPSSSSSSALKRAFSTI